MTGNSPSLSLNPGFIWLGLLNWIICVALFAGLSVFQFLGSGLHGDTLFEAVFKAQFLIFPTLGVLIISRQPGNRIGWLFCLIGIIWIGLMLFTETYVNYAITDQSNDLPLVQWAAWVSGWSWILGGALIINWLILLFPDGRLPGPRWRFLAWVAGTGIAIGTLAFMFTPGQIESTELVVANPVGIDGARSAGEFAAMAAIIMIAIAAVGSTTSLVVRFRRSKGIERLQLKWFAYAASLATAVFLLSAFSFALSEEAGERFAPLSAISLIALPLGAGIAILRYRLYEIDRLINRTLVYGSLTALLLLSFAGSVVLFQFLLSPITSGNDLAVAGSTLLIAALFRPARNRLQQFVDRRFYRRKYDTQQTLQTFSVTARDAVQLEELTSELTSVVTRTVQPEHISIWMNHLDLREERH